MNGSGKSRSDVQSSRDPAPDEKAASAAPFERLGEGGAVFPVLLSVPHAGRAYPDRLLAHARVPLATLEKLEDRHADLLIANCIAAGVPALVVRTPRALIDLNRDPRDIDVRMVRGLPRHQALVQSAKQRGGLGLFPRSLPRAGDLWHGPIEWDEARLRIEGTHLAFHAALSAEIDRLQAACDEVLLLDVHSMPPLVASPGEARPDVVIGDRFGVSARSRLSDIARDVVERHGLRPALNHPYPGYYMLERHGQPAWGRHALQIEISRDLYLDEHLRAPGAGLDATRRMLTDLVFALAEELDRARWSEAAE